MAEGTMREAVAAALADATLETRDAGARALALQYAALIDEAAPKAVYEEALRTLADATVDLGPEVDKALRKVAAALSAHSVASDLGPKLLAVLLALGMAPAGRGVKGGGQVVPVATKLDELRARREARANGAQAVDPASA